LLALREAQVKWYPAPLRRLLECAFIGFYLKKVYEEGCEKVILCYFLISFSSININFAAQ